jgi:hypothetical protein
MKQTTKKFLSVTAASALVIGLVSGVFAHGGYGSGPGWGGNHHMMGGAGGMMGGAGGMMGGAGGMMGGAGGMMGGAGGMMGRSGGMMYGDPVAHADQSLTEIKKTLAITAEQESAWKSYADAIKGKAGLMLAHRQTMHGSKRVTPDQQFTLHQQGLEQMQKINTASRELYKALTTEQQARAGNIFGMHCG